MSISLSFFFLFLCSSDSLSDSDITTDYRYVGKKTEKTDVETGINTETDIVTEILLQSEERYREKEKRFRFKMNTDAEI